MRKHSMDSRGWSALLVLLLLAVGLISMLVGDVEDTLRARGILPTEADPYVSTSIDWSEIYPSHETKTETEVEQTSVQPTVSTVSGHRSVLDRFYNLIVKLGQFESSSEEHFVFRRTFLELSGYVSRMLGKTDFGEASEVAQLSNGYLSSTYKWDGYNKASIDAEAEEIGEFAAWLKERDIGFFYAQIPTKIDKYDPNEENKAINLNNDYYDYYDSKIREQGIEILDLRDEIHNSSLSHYDLFFKTDGHWTLQAGKWAAGVIASKINTAYGASLDTSILDDSNYTEKVYPKKFLGALGRKVTLGYVDPDDFSIFFPKFDTDLRLIAPDRNLDLRGSFEDVMVNFDLFNIDDYYGTSIYEAIAYGNRPLLQVHNYKAEAPIRVLFIRDSFSLAVIPYFSLMAEDTDWIDVRTTNGNFNGSIKTYVEETNPDVVVLMYDMVDYDIN